MLDILEARHDWAKMVFTPELFKHVLTQLIPDVLWHSKSQDEEQVRDHYDRTSRVFTRHSASLTSLPRLQEAMTSTNGLYLTFIPCRPVMNVDAHLSGSSAPA